MKETVHYVGQQLIWMAYVTRELILAMGLGVKWIFMTIRMLLFGALIGPFFVPSIVWYIVSPTVIRRVSYRTSKTTRARFLRKLLRKARREVKEEAERVHHQQQHQQPSRPEQATAPSCEKSGVPTSRWARLAATVPNFLTPSASRRSLSLSAVSDDSDGSLAPLLPDGEAVSRSPEPSNPGDQPEDGFAYLPLEAESGPRPVTPVHTSSEEDEDEAAPVDVEDQCNLHNRATLDIFLPCPLDELLQVQQRSVRTGVYAPSPAPADKDKRRTRPEASRRGLTAGVSQSRIAEEQLEPKTYPIVISISGGAWIIGSHLWSALLARLLASQGYLVFCPDYRNFPQANMAEMTRDVSDAIGWVLQHARRYNGDLNRVTLIGQSAGAHLAWMSVISQARLAAAAEAATATASPVPSPLLPATPQYRVDREEGAAPPSSLPGISLAATLNSATQQWFEESTTTTYAQQRTADTLEAPLPSESLQHAALVNSSQQQLSDGNCYHQSVYDVPRYDPRNSIHHFVCLSGIYDLAHLLRHFHGRGLYRKVLYRIAGSKERLRNEFCINRYFDIICPAAATDALLHSTVTTTTDGPGTDVAAPPHEHSTKSGGGAPDCTASPALKLDDHGLLSSTMPEFLRKACRDSQGQDSLWAVERVLLNDSFLEPEALTETFPRSMKALLSSHAAVGSGIAGSSTAFLPQGTAILSSASTCHSRDAQRNEGHPDESSKLAFVRYLPPLISFLHGDADASAPFSEPVKLYRRIREAQKYLAAKSGDTSPAFSAAAGDVFQSEVRLVCIAKGTHTNIIVEELLTGKSCVVRWLSKDDQRRRQQRRPVAAKSVSAPSEADGRKAHVAQDDLHTYAVISMETPPSAQRLLVRLASFVCPF